MIDDWEILAHEVDVLATRAQAGDGAALTVLLDRYQPLLRAHARAFYRRVDGACSPEDLLQEAAIAFIESVTDYRPDRGPFGPFAKRKVFWGLVRQHRGSVSQISIQDLDEALVERLESSGLLAASDTAETQVLNGLQEALNVLTERQRHVLGMYYWLDLSVSEIADRLGLSERAIYRIRQRAENRLRVALDGGQPRKRHRRKAR